MNRSPVTISVKIEIPTVTCLPVEHNPELVNLRKLIESTKKNDLTGLRSAQHNLISMWRDGKQPRNLSSK